jgi:hypothetical protein
LELPPICIEGEAVRGWVCGELVMARSRVPLMKIWSCPALWRRVMATWVQLPELMTELPIRFTALRSGLPVPNAR